MTCKTYMLYKVAQSDESTESAAITFAADKIKVEGDSIHIMNKDGGLVIAITLYNGAKHREIKPKEQVMDALSHLEAKWRQQDTRPRVSIMQDSQRAIFFARQQCADELAALRPVIEKLVEAGQAARNELCYNMC